MCEGVGKHGAVAIIDQPEVSSVQDRVAGFLSGLSQLQRCTQKGIAMIKDGDIDVGVRHKELPEAIGELLRVHKHLGGIFFVNDESLLAALPVLDSIKDRARILVGYDAITEVKRKIDQLIVYGDTQQQTKRLGSQAIDEVHAYFNGAVLNHRVVILRVGVYPPHRRPTSTAPPS